MSAENVSPVDTTVKSPDTKAEPYRVLARKYRPQNFDELIGQDALVRTLKNSIDAGRVAHAFMLTGVRGVGKTTTARIIAKALNYAGPDGTAGPTTGNTDDCPICQAITEDRHPDILEMDAASHNGVENMRDLMDGVRYAPTQARYKIYIIDEVHMLSTPAFNALLKTLEEPPEHVKFIFATTEIRKVPITVLSRCQRFDLRRVDVPTLSSHFKNICTQEGTAAEEEAIALISRAADGSVRDGLSLLDQAIALSGETITGQQVKDMLGLADRARSLDLIEKALQGDTAGSLTIMDDLYRAGADPVVLMQDLLGLSHVLTRLKAVPASKDIKDAMAEDEMNRAADITSKVSMAALGKTWQLLLKGLSEVQAAPNPQSAAEMVIIRLIYAANLPDPSDLVKKLGEGNDGTLGGSSGGGASGGGSPSGSGGAPPSARMRVVQGGRGGIRAAAVAQPAPMMDHAPMPDQAPAVSATIHEMPAPSARAETLPAEEPESQYYEDVIDTLADVILALEHGGDFLLASQVYQYMHLVSLKQGHLEVCLAGHAPDRLAQDVSAKLRKATNENWMVSLSTADGAPTLADQAKARKEQDYADVMATPVIAEIMQVFPDAELVDIQDAPKRTAQTQITKQEDDE